ncbi:MAG: translation initiation factor IF-2 subunit gamma [Thermoplasmatota archaeon]
MKVKTQPEVNIGLVGHVDHGKTTLTEALSGVWADTHSEEIKRGITIKLGYADTEFYKCTDCDEPRCYSTKPKCPNCGGKCEYLRSVSFVDAPGHETLMATMLSGAAIMDGSLLMIAANEKCPQPQTREHLMALDFIGVKNVIVVQTKIDLVSRDRAKESYQEIKDFVNGTVAEGAPVIPVSAHHGANLDLLISVIQSRIQKKEHDAVKPFKMYIARSFDVNKPGTNYKELSGGVIGGSLVRGELRIGDEVEIRPGIKVEEKGTSGYKFKPLRSTVTTMMAGGKSRKMLHPGGLVGIGTHLDPNLTKSDSLIGGVMGSPGTLPDVVEELTLETYLMEYLVGLEKEVKVDKIRTKEVLMLNIGTATTVGIVTSPHDNRAEMDLKMPICVEKGQRVAISRRIGNKFRLIGYGRIV